MPEYVYDEGNWKYVEICGRVKDLGCSEWFPSICERLICECISRSRTMEVAVVIFFVRTNETGIICGGWQLMWIWIIRMTILMLLVVGVSLYEER